MKLDFETLQFERQLKRAKRLSLLEFAANERRKQRSALAVRSRKPSTTAVDASLKRKNAAGVTVKRLRRAAVRRIVNRRNSIKSRRQTVRSPSITLRKPLSFMDGNGSCRPTRVDVNASLEVVSSDFYDGIDSGFDDVPVIENIDHPTNKKLPQPSFRLVKDYEPPPNVVKNPEGYYRFIEKTTDELDDEIEYDVDEEDLAWLELLNNQRRLVGIHGHAALSVEAFEMVMDRFEKEAHEIGQHVVVGTKVPVAMPDDDALCAICGDDECTNTNAILFCDACNLAVHQECYGVPFVPEGQWLCRRCQAGVDADVPCCLCPVRGGAVKKTNDNRWAHVVCALWIPEVGFGNIELLEPITKLNRVPPARHRLTCAVCGKNRVGACVQCMRKHCYKAFHITCAQQVGLYMKIEPLLDANGVMVNVSKILLCDNHKPPGVRPFQPMIDNSIDNDGRPPAPKREKPRPLPKGARKQGGRRHKAVAETEEQSSSTCDIPVIPVERLQEIGQSLAFRDKNRLLTMLQAYWLLKRRSRNGLPLLRRLQISGPSSTALKSEGNEEVSEVVTDFMRIKKLRQEMEKVRLLLELIRKRERNKLELIRMHELALRLKLEPFTIHLHRTLDQLQVCDTAKIFAHPVSVEEAPGYLTIIKHPMDFSTMRSKIDAYAYKSFKEFETDFWFVVDNCQTYNADGSIYFKLASKLGQQGRAVLDMARKAANEADYCCETGLHSICGDEVHLSTEETKSSISSPVKPGVKAEPASKIKAEPASPAVKKSPCARGRRWSSLETVNTTVKSSYALRDADVTSAVESPVENNPSKLLAGSVHKRLPVKRGRRCLSLIESIASAVKSATPLSIADPEPQSCTNDNINTEQEAVCRRRTRSSVSASDENFEALPLYRVNGSRKRQRVVRSKSNTDDDDGPPELSRCPSPVNEPECLTATSSLISATSPGEDDSSEMMSVEPPALTRSEPSVGDLTPPYSVDVPGNGKIAAAVNDSFPRRDNTKRDDNICAVMRFSDRSGHVKSEDTSLSNIVLRNRRQIGSPDDTLDSIASCESPVYATASCDNVMPALVTDCDSSYGSTCGRDGVQTSDSDATSGCSPVADREADCNQSMSSEKSFALNSCDVC